MTVVLKWIDILKVKIILQKWFHLDAPLYLVKEL